MLRSLTGIGIALALVGSAHAQEQQISVRLDGKSPRVLRAELYRAAQKVCTGHAVEAFEEDSICVRDSYEEALARARAAARAQHAALVQAGPFDMH